MNENFIATVDITINTPLVDVWKALTDPEKIKQYMFGAEVVTDWKEGSKIVWKGIWQGKEFEDRGKIVIFDPEKKLVVTHWSPMSGVPETSENHHIVTYELSFRNGMTHVVLTQDNNANEDEKRDAEMTWNMMLGNLKNLVENNT